MFKGPASQRNNSGCRGTTNRFVLRNTLLLKSRLLKKLRGGVNSFIHIASNKNVAINMLKFLHTVSVYKSVHRMWTIFYTGPLKPPQTVRADLMKML